MAMKAKSEEEKSIIKLRTLIIEKIGEEIKDHCEETAYTLVQILQALPIYIDYEE